MKMNKKGLSGQMLIVIIIVGFLVICGFIALLVVLNQKEVKNTEINSNINLYLKANYNQKQIGGEYFVNGESGKLSENAYTEIKNLSNYLDYEILVSSPGFYSKLINKSFTEEEKSQNASKVNFNLEKVGIVSISHQGILEDGEKTIILNISSKDYFQKLEICVSWTPNIISVNSEPKLLCNWTNESGKYYCNGVEEFCNSLIGDICYPKQNGIPNRFKNEVDKCFYYGNNLKNSYVLIPFTIKSEVLNSLDQVTFIILDNQVVYSNGFKYLSELNENLGSQDFIYIINGQA
jgi:hypothetical protein